MLQLVLLCIISCINSSRIAIIGGGIGGASTAYYLSKNKDMEVDLYEKLNRVGGRVYAENIYNKTINLGASFFIKENQLLYNLIQEIDLEVVPTMNNRKMAIVSGKEMVYKFSDYKLINLIKLVWKYGLSPIKVGMICDHHLKNFLKIYDYLDKKHNFRDLEELLTALQLNNLVDKTIRTFLIENGVSKEYVDEFIDAFIAGIYNQHSEINAFAGFITLAGVSYQTYEVKGGNNQVIVKLFDQLKEVKNFKLYLNKTISSIKKVNNNYLLNGKEYDYVIIACPLEKTGIKFENITIHNSQPHVFQSTYVTVIKGEVISEYFGQLKDSIDTILSSNKNSTEHISDVVSEGDGIIKVQSDKPLLSTSIVRNETILKRQVWEYAYPKLVPIKRNELPSFVLDKGLYYINAIEAAGSCMELSMISGRNIINMIENKARIEFPKSEL